MTDLQLVDIEDDAGQHVVELVRETTGHLAEGLQLLALGEALFEQLLLGGVDDVGGRGTALAIEYDIEVD